MYFKESRELTCAFCHRTFRANASCLHGHYVCDRCHAERAIDGIVQACRAATSRDPAEIAVSMMKDPFVHMHGPENHVLVGAALLAAYHNADGQVSLDDALPELVRRGGQVPGGACGFFGCCGAAVSTGIFVSLVTGSTPLAGREFVQCNRMTSQALATIGEIGGPRCCKRNAFLAIRQAVVFCREELGVEMTQRENYLCEFSPRNAQCLGMRCPFHAHDGKISFC